MDKKVKWALIIGTIVILAVPTSILSAYFIIKNLHLSTQEDEGGMINHSGAFNFSPTPNSDIKFSYSINESIVHGSYLYQFNYTFDVLEGIELSYIDDYGWVITVTQLYLTILGNNGTDFYTDIKIMNMTELQVDNSQVNHQKMINATGRFENLVVNLQIFKRTNGEEGATHFFRGCIPLFTKENVIFVEETTEFSGNLYFWINENNYSLYYEVFSNSSLFYTVNSSIGDLELYYGQISIMGYEGTHGTQLGSFEFPYAPMPQGDHSNSYNLTFTSQYESFKFCFIVGVEGTRAEVDYKIISISEYLAQQEDLEAEKQALEDEQFHNMLNNLFRYTILTALGVAIILGCMVNAPRK